MEIGGLPLHPLVVHGAVVFTPLAALALITFAVLPRYRYLTRWPAAILAVLAFGAVWAARITGQWMLEQNPSIEQLVGAHVERAKLLSLVVLALVVATGDAGSRAVYG